MTPTPPGWYADPTPSPGHAPAQRWWDGQAWTAHLAPTVPDAPAPGRHRTTVDGEELAGWGRRLAAYLLDSLVVLAVWLVAAYPFWRPVWDAYVALFRQLTSSFEAGATSDPAGPLFEGLWWPMFWSAVVMLLVSLVYHGAYLRATGATPGKKWLGLRVRLAERPGRLPWRAVGLRLLATYGPAAFSGVPLLELPANLYPFLDGLWASWDRRRQALHDKLAGTQVVRVR